MDDMDVTSSMNTLASSKTATEPYMLTVKDAAALLGIGRTLAYQLVRRYVETGGAEGIPVVRVGRLWRVPRQALFEQIQRGCIGASSGLLRDELAPRRRPSAEEAGGPGAAGRRLTIRRGGPAARGPRSRREPPSQQLPLFPAG